MTRRKKLNNIFLILMTVSAVLTLINFKNSTHLPAFIVMIASFFYLGWALIYHKLDKSLTLSIFLEYVLTVVLVLILLTGVFIS